MEPKTIPFQRGGMPFEGQITTSSCTIRDLVADPRFGMGYKIEIDEIRVRTKRANRPASIVVNYTFGLEATTGEIVNAIEDSWTFYEGHPDLEFFQETFGLSFMGSCINGFVKHKMPQNPRYSESSSKYLPVLDDAGNYLPENND